MDSERVRRRLLTVIRLLAQPAATQITHLNRLGVDDGAGELRHQYEEALEAAADFLGRGGVSGPQAQALRTLSAHFHAMQLRNTPQLWTNRALHRAPEWSQVRELAAHVLVAFDAWPRRWGKARWRAIRDRAESSRQTGLLFLLLGSWLSLG
jgi:hypothetical protein